MLNTEEVLEFLRRHRRALESDFHIMRIGLIGSFTRGDQTEKSDIELLVEFEHGTDDIFDNKIKLKDLLKA